MRPRTAARLFVPFVALLVAGCPPPGMEKRLAQLESQQVDLIRRAGAAEAELARVKNLAADVEAVKAYFKQVADRVRSIRDDMVRLLDEQSMRVEEGRQEYVRILRTQEQILSQLVPEITKAIQSLEKKLPEAESLLPKGPEPPRLNTPPAPLP